MRASVHSAPGWELGPRARNTSEGEGKGRQKAGWARSRLSWGYRASLWWDGLQFQFFSISGGSCELHREFHQGSPDFLMVFSVFSWPTWRGSRLPRKLMVTCLY